MSSKNLEFIISAEDQFSKPFSKLIDFLKTPEAILAGSITAGAGVTVMLGKITSEVAEAYEKVSNVSEKLGITTEALSELQYAAKQSGIESNTFDMALQRMVRRSAEAAQGFGEASGALKELGLSASQLASMSPDEQLKAIADALQLVPSEADKVRLAFKLFDSEGVALVQMLKDGSAEIQKFSDEAHKLGVVVSEEMSEAAKEYTEEQKRFNASWQGLKNKIAEEFLGPGTKALELMGSMVEDLKGLVGGLFELKDAALDAAGNGLTTLGEILKEDGEAMDDFMTKYIMPLINQLDKLSWADGEGGWLDDYLKKQSQAEQKLREVEQQHYMVISSVKAEAASLKDLQNAYDAFYGYTADQATKGFEINLKVNATSLKAISDQLKEFKATLEGADGAGLGAEIDRSTINVADLQNEMAALKTRAEEIKLSGINSDYAVEEIERISDQMQGVKEKLSVLAEPKLKLEALEADFKLAEGGFTEVRNFISQPINMSVNDSAALASLFNLRREIQNLDGQKITVYVEAQGTGGVSQDTVAEIDKQLAENIKRGSSAVGAALTQ